MDNKIEKVKLSEWAKANNKSYKQSWQMVEHGEFPEKIEKTKTNRIFVLRESKASENKPVNFVIPTFAGQNLQESFASNSRRNRAATIERTDPYWHIENGLSPFISGQKTREGNDTISPSEAIRLTQLAYYNFSDFSNVINIMTEFSTNDIYLRGGNKKSRDFFYALFKKINIQSLQEKFFLEYYRSGNVFPYRLEAIIKDDDLNKMNQVYGVKISVNEKTKKPNEIKLPVKYIIINPSSIICAGSISFSNAQFSQKLNSYEIQRLKKPITEEDENFYNSLPEDIKKQLKNSSSNSSILLPLDPQYVYFIFWKKQDYEPLSIPMGWGVLRDLNWKAEMKAIDMSVARTTQRAVLLITMGFENKNGEYMVDAKAMEAMRLLFESESVGKVLVGDFTTKGQWLIPDVDKLLGPEKYQQVNQDIQQGLNNILVGSNEKFANQSIKVKLFIERLKQAREAFLNEFLSLEIKRISKDLNFKSYPQPLFMELDLKDEDLWNRIIAQLAQMGVLTSWETTKAIETGVLPDKEESIENQKEFKKLKDEGLFMAVQQNPSSQLQILDKQGKQQEKIQQNQLEHDGKQKSADRKHAAENPPTPSPQIVLNTKLKQQPGKPTGTKNPGIKKKIAKPISASLIKENLILATKLNNELNKELCKKYKLEKLNEEQDKFAGTLLENIMCGEEPKNWLESIAKYLENPDYINQERFEKIRQMAENLELNDYSAAIAYNSTKKDNENI